LNCSYFHSLIRSDYHDCFSKIFFPQRNHAVTAFRTVFVLFAILAHFSEFGEYLNPWRSNKNSLSHPFAHASPPSGAGGRWLNQKETSVVALMLMQNFVLCVLKLALHFGRVARGFLVYDLLLHVERLRVWRCVYVSKCVYMCVHVCLFVSIRMSLLFYKHTHTCTQM